MVYDKIQNKFRFFSHELVTRIEEEGVYKHLGANDIIMQPDQYIRSFPLCIDGRVRISTINEDGNEVLLYYLLPGEVCSLSLICCMSHTQSKVQATCEIDTELVFVSVNLLNGWMDEFQEWKAFVMNSYQVRFNDLLNTVDSIAFMKLDERLVRFFTNYHASSGLDYYNGTHNDIALSLNSSREVITRLLKKMEQNNMIVLKRNKITFSNMV